MIIGADGTRDTDILKRSARLYGGYRLKRVYYSAFSPIPDLSAALPLIRPPLMREHRLYQADWLTRFYGFAHSEIAERHPDGMLDLDIDPKLAWALAHRALSRSTSTRPTASCCCACRGSAPRSSNASSRRGDTVACASTMSAGSASRSPRSGPSSSPKAGRRAD